jgi:hypothetical protein
MPAALGLITYIFTFFFCIFFLLRLKKCPKGMYLCYENIMNGIVEINSASPMKSSQSLFVEAERLFTFQPGLHPGYYAPVLKSALQRAR